MKKFFYLLFPCFIFLSNFSFAQQAVTTIIPAACADLSPMKQGELTFKVNNDSKNNYKFYPTRYKIKFYLNEKKMKGQKFYLAKGKNNSVSVKLVVDSTKIYCVRISRNAILNIIYKKICWEKPAPGAFLNNGQITYYVSTSRNAILFPTKITSKDGPTGDGVKVLID